MLTSFKRHGDNATIIINPAFVRSIEPYVGAIDVAMVYYSNGDSVPIVGSPLVVRDQLNTAALEPL